MTAAYVYRADGLRNSKVVNGHRTTHVWERGSIILELNGSGAVVNRFSRGVGHLIHSEHHGFYLFNVRTDVIQRVDSNGNILHTYRYDAFGNQLNGSETNTNPFRFAAEYYDWETGFIYLRARFYNPAIGRFISEDPHWDIFNMQSGTEAILQSGNLFIFVMNNPVMFLDPSGRVAMPIKEALFNAAKWALGALGAGVGIGSLTTATPPPVTSTPIQRNTSSPPTTVIGGQFGPSVEARANRIASANAAASAFDEIMRASEGSGSSRAAGVAGGAVASTPPPDGDNRGFDNLRVLQEVTIRGYRVSMDLERGGSGLYNIHLKVDNVKYFYNAGRFVNAAGKEIPHVLRANPQVQRGLTRALDAMGRGW